MATVNDLAPDPFDAPAEPGFIGKDTMHELHHSLLIVMPTAFREHYPTRYTKPNEQAPAVQVDVLVADGPRRGEFFEGAWFWQIVLVRQFSTRLGKVIAGRLEQGASQPGSNNSPPWQIVNAEPGTPDRAEANRAYQAWKATRNADPFAS